MFRINSRFYTACQWIYRLFIINLLFILTSLPVMTLGASMQATMNSLCLPIDQPCFLTFFKTFKENIFRTVPFFLFNMCSLLFIFSFNTYGIKEFGLLYVIKYIFLIFLLAYNINLYIANLKIERSTYIEVFRMSFYITVSSFVKIGFFWGVYSIVTFTLLKNFPTIFLLWGWSIPLFLQVIMIKKECRFLSSLKKQDKEVLS